MAQNARLSGIPRYYSVWRTLWSRITSGYYPAGSLIGTEVALAQELGVSRVTLREALSLLESEGLVDRRRSLGTFVADDVTPRGVVEFTGYLDDVMLQADSSETVYYKRSLIAAPEAAAAALGLRANDQVIRLQRLRSAQGIPRLWLIDYLPVALGEQFSDDELRNTSILQLLDGRADTHMSSGQQTIHAEIGEPSVCKRLGLAPGSAVLACTRTIFDKAFKPLTYVEMYYPGERFSFDIRLGRA